MFHLIFIDNIFQDGPIINEVHGEEEHDSKSGVLNTFSVCTGTIDIPESLHIN